MNLALLIDRNARLYPNNVALSLGKTPYATYGQMAKRIRAISHELRVVRQYQLGARVGLTMSNTPEFWEILFGIWHAGMIAVPMNPKLHPREFEYIIEHAGVGLCFATPDLYPGMTELPQHAGREFSLVNVDSHAYQTIRDANVPDLPPHPADAADTAWLFYTSGTTGRPKGAMLSHRNLLTMVFSFLADMDVVGPEDCVIHAAPQSHGAGLWGMVHFAQASNNITPESGGFDADEIADLLNHYKGVSMFAAPTMVNRLVQSDAFRASNLNNLRSIVYGGAPMYVADLRRAVDLMGEKLIQIYGQGESPMTITALPKAFHLDTGHPHYLDHLASVGFQRLGVEVRILDPDGQPLPAGDIGEIVVKGDVVMSGYWNDPKATETALRDGWLYTGDVGSMDSSGFLTLRDRSKDLIISGGSNIYPREVEEVLLNYPGVHEVSVVGRPSAEWGEDVVAFVVLEPGCTISAAELDRQCLDNIARFKRPKDYIFLPELPKSHYGKILKTELRKFFQEA